MQQQEPTPCWLLNRPGLDEPGGSDSLAMNLKNELIHQGPPDTPVTREATFCGCPQQQWRVEDWLQLSISPISLSSSDSLQKGSNQYLKNLSKSQVKTYKIICCIPVRRQLDYKMMHAY